MQVAQDYYDPTSRYTNSSPFPLTLENRPLSKTRWDKIQGGEKRAHLTLAAWPPPKNAEKEASKTKWNLKENKKKRSHLTLSVWLPPVVVIFW